MVEPGLIPRGEGLRRAVRWLGERGPCTPTLIEEAARRFDLSPRDEEFLLRAFLPGSGDRGPPGAA